MRKINDQEAVFFHNIQTKIKDACAAKKLKVSWVLNQTGMSDTGYSLAIKHGSLNIKTLIRIGILVGKDLNYFFDHSDIGKPKDDYIHPCLMAM